MPPPQKATKLPGKPKPNPELAKLAEKAKPTPPSEKKTPSTPKPSSTPKSIPPAIPSKKDDHPNAVPTPLLIPSPKYIHEDTYIDSTCEIVPGDDKSKVTTRCKITRRGGKRKAPRKTKKRSSRK